MRNFTERTIEIGAWITLSTVLLYTAGWSYAYHWFDRFNLGMIQLGIPTEYHLMYGFWVLRDHAWWLLTAFVLALVLWYSRPPMPHWARWGALPLLVAVFMLVYAFGEKSADHDFRQHRADGFQSYPWTRVWLAAESKADPVLMNLAGELAAGRYRLLVQSETSLFLIKPKQQGEMPTVRIPLRRVTATRRMPVNPGRR
uniref:Uncharacterized protein n=1 Tax=Candidatus Kentrum sp. LPFa TaxID=2126335 RepID=A0A450VR55_9GAMM|nr:MAG: hypothetical protein BECKLPF1236A_GA0070988_1000829 [Candidatus Kentron sp. LPFa]VFK23999.1 MAG: hypothetical protein BECKLPF1236C_GA0070990_1000929 [Candidatus Kentron sp. LPFa]